MASGPISDPHNRTRTDGMPGLFGRPSDGKSHLGGQLPAVVGADGPLRRSPLPQTEHGHVGLTVRPLVGESALSRPSSSAIPDALTVSVCLPGQCLRWTAGQWHRPRPAVGRGPGRSSVPTTSDLGFEVRGKSDNSVSAINSISNRRQSGDLDAVCRCVRDRPARGPL